MTVLLAVLGICGGLGVSWGTVSFLTGLKIIPRYGKITNTEERIRLYEDAAVLGTLTGTILYLYGGRIPAGIGLVTVIGILAGIFQGSWIIALGEIADVFPVLLKKTGLQDKKAFVIYIVAAGKIAGSLLFFRKGWY